MLISSFYNHRNAILFISVFLVAVIGVPAQALGPQTERPVESLTAREMFDEVNQFTRNRFTELESKGVVISDEAREETLRDQKRLGKRYLEIAQGREGNKGDDLYYIGMLGWISQEFDVAMGFLQRYVSENGSDRDKIQVSRSISVVILARKGEVQSAQKVLESYLKENREKPRERLRMESELSVARKAKGDLEGALLNALNAFKAAVELAEDPRNSLNAFIEVINMGMESFDLCSALRRDQCATKSLEDLREASFKTDSPITFFMSTDALIRHHAERGRKRQAMELFQASTGRDLSRFSNPLAAADAGMRLRSSEKQFLLIGEPAIELSKPIAVFPESKNSLASLKGKILLLDFWATWCLPCFDAFPKLNEWQAKYLDDLVVIGATRLYGTTNGEDVSEKAEIAFLREFKAEQTLNYRIHVARDLQDELSYGIRALPTVVLVDRKGRIRYIESGSSNTRLERLRLKVEELVSEQ